MGSLVLRGALVALLVTVALAHGGQSGGSNNKLPPFCSDGTCVPKPPNILFFLHDDQDALLGSPNYMHYTQQHMVYEGVTFRRGYVSTSLCCPSRVSILRGQYVSNHQIYTNNLPKGGFNKHVAMGYERDSLPNWLKKRGYTTALVGKYLNDYREGNTSHVPKDWDEWFVVVSDDEDPWDVTQYSHNGRRYDGTGEYQTDTLKEKGLDFLRNHFLDKKGKLKSDVPPFFLWLGPEAPHSPADPAPRHANIFPNVVHPRIGAWNESFETLAEKPTWVRNLPPTTPARVIQDDTRFRNRVRSLQATDEMLHETIKFLEQIGQLDNTIIIYTSDNGMHFNQHRMTNGKRMAYEEDIRVPFYIRGPGIPRNRVSDAPILNVDIPATILDAAGIPVPSFVDGVSFLEAARQAVPWEGHEEIDSARSVPLRSQFLIFSNQTFGGGNDGNLYLGIRKVPSEEDPSDFTYVEWPLTNEFEYYDNANDPSQFFNLYSSLPQAEKDRLHTVLNEFAICTGASCRALNHL